MQRYLLPFILLFTLAFSAYALSQHPFGSWRVPPDDPLSQGGRLYDKWWAELNLPKPTATHPAYPAAGKQRGADTWRCKECHGWDYRGRDGAYAKGSHFTGIKGIRAYTGADPAVVVQLLSDSNHQYQTRVPPHALQLLASFVVQGQIEMEHYIDPASGTPRNADQRLGARLFDNNCARCHDEDGRYQNFSGDPADPEYIGTVAQGNPWETWHKIRNGHPGSRMPMGHGMMGRWQRHETMPTFRSFSLEEQLAILAHARTLPVK